MQTTWLARIYQLLFLLLPWSVEADFGVWKLTVPAEPLIALAGIGLLVELLRSRRIPRLKNSLTRITIAWIGWLTIAVLFSSMPLVSWKYWLVETGHWWVFFAGLYCFPEWWPRLFRLFSWSMLGVVLYTLCHHAFYQFRADQAMLAPIPFFPDHTVYSVVLVLLLFTPNPFPKGEWRFPSGYLKILRKQAHAPFGVGLVLLALALASSRAAWLSLLLAGLAGFLIYFKKYRWWGILSVGIVLCAGIFFQEKIQTRLASDVSWQERLNRYACAGRMAFERPWTGFGPGTFQFQYFQFQRPEEMTRISRTEPIRKRGPENYGRGGGGHSEYLQALAELGWPGFALWLLLVFSCLYVGIRRFRETGTLFWLLLSLALFSFFLHGLANNFLHDARVAALVWGMIALIARGR